MNAAWEFPIEQLLRLRDERFQYRFAVAAKALVLPRAEFALQATSEGLYVSGCNEDALVWPVEILKERYGERLQAGAPRVRLWEGTHVHEPIMSVRIQSPRAAVSVIEDELQRRGVPVAERYLARVNGVLRSEAPLAQLIGLPARLRKVTNDTARHWITLSHYARRMPDPPGGAAA